MSDPDDIEPWDAPDPTHLRASQTPSPARSQAPQDEPNRPRRRLLKQSTTPSPVRRSDDVTDAPPAPTLVEAVDQAHVAEASDEAEPAPPVAAPEVPAAAPASDDDPVVADAFFDSPSPQVPAAPPASPAPPAPESTPRWTPVLLMLGLTGTLALLGTIGLALGWRIGATATEAVVDEQADAVPVEAVAPAPTAPVVVPVEAAAEPEPEPEPVPDTPPSAPRADPVPAPRAAPAPRPPAPKRAAPPTPSTPPPPAAAVRPRDAEEPPQATVRPVTEEDGRKVFAPWGDEAADGAATPAPAPPPADEEDAGDVWGSTE